MLNTRKNSSRAAKQAGRKYSLRNVSERLAPLFPSSKVNGSTDPAIESARFYALMAKYLKPESGHYYNVSLEDVLGVISNPSCRRQMAKWASYNDVFNAFHDYPSRVLVFEDDNVQIFRKAGQIDG